MPHQIDHHIRQDSHDGRNCQDLWIGVSCGLSIASGIIRSVDEFPVLEAGAGADEGEQVGAFTARRRVWADSVSLNAIATPAGLRAGSLGDMLLQPHGRKMSTRSGSW